MRYLRDFFMGILRGTVTLTFVNQPLLLDQNYGFRFKDVFCIAYTPVIFPLFNFYFYVFLGSVSILEFTSNVRAITK